MKKVTMYIFIAIMFLSTGVVFSQSVSLDAVSGGVSNDTIFINQQVEFDIRMVAGGTVYSGITNGFRVFSDDGAEWTTTIPDTFSLGWQDMFDIIFNVSQFSITGSGADTVGFGGAKLSGSGLLGSFNEVSYSIEIGPISPLSHRKTICLDSAFYLPSGTWKWQPTGASFVVPNWDGPHCYIVIDPSAPLDPSNIVLSTNYLDFNSVEGEGAPDPQTFDVLTDLDPLDFTLHESADWIFISPTQGTTDQTITTTINPTGLTDGTYIDSIEVLSPTADNSPQWVIVTLVVAPPPPTIGVSLTSLFFNAIAGEANPDDKLFSIFNTNPGSSDLEWSVSNSESWLSLTPSSGTNSGDVLVSVDIIGLSYNDYSDTIIITDPQASNDPVKIPVNLSVGSDLPLIAVDSVFNYLIIPGNSGSIPARDIQIYNAGAGGMSYSLTESSSRILTLNPSSGVAPETVSVGFKINSGNPGDDYTDTLWVHSPEAINSPYPVLFHFHFVNIPAEIVMVDTIEIDMFECDQGYLALNHQSYFHISNVAGAESYNPQYHYESDLFFLEFENNSIPEFVSVIGIDLQLPLGTYYDTVTVTAQKAINSPQDIIVKYNVVPGFRTPKIALPNDKFIITARENEGPTNYSILPIFNLYGGCMEWSLVEDISWLYPNKTEGNVPDVVSLLANATGYTRGAYYDTLEIHAPLALNSPDIVAFELKVWSLAGDFDWNGIIDISDLVLMVDFFFYDGAGPIPESRVGDLNCDIIIDIADLVILADFMFNHGPSPCGNP